MRRLAAADLVIVTAAGTVQCDSHAWMVVPEAITARGTYVDVRTAAKRST